MALSKELRKKLAQEHLLQWYPDVDAATKQLIMSIVVRQFNGNYSPDSGEHDTRGTGTGLTFLEYVLLIAWERSGTKPPGYNAEQLHSLSQRGSM